MGESLFNKLVWLGMIAIIVVMSQTFYNKLIRSGGTLSVITANQHSNTVLLRWEGPVQPPMKEHIYAAYKKYRYEKKNFILSIDSNGGLVSYGGKVIRVLRQIRKTHHLETRVGYGDKCLSMCVPIYLQGETRSASKGSRWMFHEVRQREAISDKAVYSDRRDVEKWTTELVERYFKPAGLDEIWLRELTQKMKGRDYWRSGRQLIQEKSGIIHKAL